MKVVGIIPARYGSTRFPGKPLTLIDGKSMIYRVYQRCKNATLLQDVVVATDNQEIYDHVTGFGGKAVMTHTDHINGTERCADALGLLDETYDAVINIQGDEPFVEPEQIDLLVRNLEKHPYSIATLIRPITDINEIENPNVVKVVCNVNNKALYFSRSVIPYMRAIKSNPTYLKHVGLYGYHVDVLKEIVKLEPTQNEQAERLEQLRWLENGFDIFTSMTDYESISIDSPDDIEKAEMFLQKLNSVN